MEKLEAWTEIKMKKKMQDNLVRPSKIWINEWKNFNEFSINPQAFGLNLDLLAWVTWSTWAAKNTLKGQVPCNLLLIILFF